MSGPDGLLALIFVHPLPFPAWLRLWMLLPLLACVAVVYRATRTRDARRLPRQTLITFVNILVGMVLIALAFWAIHIGVRQFA